jgi:hypothetical protein
MTRSNSQLIKSGDVVGQIALVRTIDWDLALGERLLECDSIHDGELRGRPESELPGRKESTRDFDQGFAVC